MCIAATFNNFLKLLAASKQVAYMSWLMRRLSSQARERILGLSFAVQAVHVYQMFSFVQLFCVCLHTLLQISAPTSISSFFVGQRRQRGTWDETHAEERYNLISTIRFLKTSKSDF